MKALYLKRYLAYVPRKRTGYAGEENESRR